MRRKFPLKRLSRKARIFGVLTLLSLAGEYQAGAQCSTTSQPTNNCSSWGDYISSFTMAGVTTNSGCGGTTTGYANYTVSQPVRNLTIGTAYPWTATIGTTDPEAFAIWIDVNNNNQFETSEMLYSNVSVSGGSQGGSLTVPSGTPGVNNVRMRVRMAYGFPAGTSMWNGGLACTNGVGSFGETEDYTVNLISPCTNPTVPTITQGASVSRCASDGPTTLSVTGTLNDATAWHWYSGSCGGTAVGTGASINVSPTTTTTYYVRGEGGCVTPGSCAQIAVNVSQPVSITTQPNANTELCDGGTLNLSVASTNGAGYQWYYEGGLITNNANTTGAQSANLQVTNIPSILSGTYHVVITGNSPCANAQSADAEVTVNNPVSITTQPSAVLSVCEGTAINLDIVASNVADYQWYGPGGMLSDVGTVTGSNTASLTVDPAAVADDGGYYVELTALPGCADDQSITSAVTVTPAVNITTNTPATLGVCDGADLNLSVVADNAVSYQWYGPSGMLMDGGDISGATTDALTVAATDASDAGVYYLEITGTSPCAVTTSTNTTVTNDLPAAITTQPTAASACSGLGSGFTVTATGANLTYQWYEGATMLSDDATYSGTNSANLVINNTSGLNNNEYSVEITGSCGSPVTSNTVMLTEDFDNTWNGSVSNSWSDGGNWSCGIVPTMVTNAIIPNVANFCTVDIPTAECNNLTIDLGGMVLFNNTVNKLSIHGDVQNNGTFNGNNGTISLAGAGSQQVSGTITFDDLEIEGGGTKVINGVATVNGELILTDGFLALGNNNLIITDMSAQTTGSAASYIVTDGTGEVVGQNMNADSTIFHVGLPLSYNPVGIKNTGDPDTFMVRVMEHVYKDGFGTDPTQVDNPVVDRTWMISEQTPGGSFASVTPQWNGAGEELNGFDQSHVYVPHFMGGIWTSPVDSTLFTPAAIAVGGMWTAMEDSIESFSPFTVASHGNFPLAIRLTSISATNVGTRNKVEWKSAKEEAGDVFELESSADARTFTKIATIAANGKPSTYTQWDATPAEGVNYYRVKLLSADGKYSYSKVVSATMSKSNDFAIEAYPNPVHNTVSVKVNGLVTGNGSVVVTDVTGKVVSRSAIVEGNRAELNVSHLANGMYLLNYSDDVRSESIKINKQ